MDVLVSAEKSPVVRIHRGNPTPHQWALTHDNGMRYGIVKIDIKALFAVCQGFRYDNNLAISGGVVLLFDKLRDTFEESFNCSCDSLNHGDVYTKPIMDVFEDFMADSDTYVVTPLDTDAFQLTHTSINKEWIVQLNGSTCTCGEFQAYKFPCLHALAVCDKMKINPLQYVDDCYTLEQYYKTYSPKFYPVPEESAWPEASGVPTLLPPRAA